MPPAESGDPSHLGGTEGLAIRRCSPGGPPAPDRRFAPLNGRRCEPPLSLVLVRPRRAFPTELLLSGVALRSASTVQHSALRMPRSSCRREDFLGIRIRSRRTARKRFRGSDPFVGSTLSGPSVGAHLRCAEYRIPSSARDAFRHHELGRELPMHTLPIVDQFSVAAGVTACAYVACACVMATPAWATPAVPAVPAAETGLARPEPSDCGTPRSSSVVELNGTAPSTSPHASSACCTLREDRTPP